MTRLRLLLAAAAVVALGAATGCTARADGAADGRLRIVTAFYPLQFVAQRIAGDGPTVGNLTKPGAEPHDVELNPRQVARIADADLVAYLKGFQPAVDQAIALEAKDRAFDAATAVPLLSLAEDHPEPGEEHTELSGGMDPHVWLDPQRLATIADRLATRVGQADPAHAADYTARAATLHRELDALDTEYATRLATCARREIVTGHSAFGYLAQRYGLTQVGITGITPEGEPSPRRLAAVAAEAERTGTTTIFFETLVSPKVAETLAREVGARTAVLDPLEGLTEPGEDYFSVMRRNLAALRTALGCTS
ncbi:zinc transport system substrate-binding protein [Krasilnikovia cinnamomea]|uniref:Zinc transport system substrate-binding protein n=1 Tax=Krasilnikovia cinnamomea TaxID=349313 RepID=A0A4Q7ZPI2_9ACTN|nr:metal ABC transporter substrate-binding protein [Krasilnikovia cinnamomea]RZU52634.1 zinc transport system substrate-binding protein [Krasilnikovia cinnamomea]